MRELTESVDAAQRRLKIADARRKALEEEVDAFRAGVHVVRQRRIHEGSLCGDPGWLVSSAATGPPLRLRAQPSFGLEVAIEPLENAAARVDRIGSRVA